jgi:hypothetical protein
MKLLAELLADFAVQASKGYGVRSREMYWHGDPLYGHTPSTQILLL